MRLPRDAVLIVVDGAEAPETRALLAVWREEELPTMVGPLDDAALDAIGATTLAICGGGDRVAAAREAAARGYRVFVVGAAPGEALPEVRFVSLATALAAARMARARERWKAARPQ